MYLPTYLTFAEIIILGFLKGINKMLGPIWHPFTKVFWRY